VVEEGRRGVIYFKPPARAAGPRVPEPKMPPGGGALWAQDVESRRHYRSSKRIVVFEGSKTLGAACLVDHD